MNRLACSSFASLGLSLWLSLHPSAVSAAEELPKDTNQIESLTPEQAKKLAAEFPGATVLIGIQGTGMRQVRACLPLNGLKSLDAETAQALAGYSKGPLLLNGLTTLPADVARSLAESKSSNLWLGSLTSLSADAAGALAEFKGASLSLDGLTEIDLSTAKALAESKAKTLALNGLATLSAGAAKALAEFKGSSLSLDGLTTIDAATAEALAQPARNSLVFKGLTTLDADTAKKLAEYKGNVLHLPGLTTLSADAAGALAEYTGSMLNLTGLTTLSDAAATSLAEFKGQRVYVPAMLNAIGGETPLTPGVARLVCRLVDQQKSVTLSVVTTIDTPEAVEVAEILATAKGKLSLPALKKISPKTLTALIQKEDVGIPLLETLELIAEPDGSPTEDFVIPKWLEGRQVR